MAVVLKVLEEYFKKICGECVEISINYEKLEPILAESEKLALFWQHVLELSEKIQELVKENIKPLYYEVQDEEKRKCISTTSEIEITNIDKNLEKPRSVLDPSLVQITATKTEIERRIGAFLKKKQLDVDVHNQREFCNLLNTENEFSCARVDAVFLPRVGQRSHITVTDASRENELMESDNITVDTILHSIPSKRQKTENKVGPTPYGVLERLQNIESHLKTNVKSVHHNIYDRLKHLEEKILYLEGLSPEYFYYKTHCPQNDINYTDKQPQKHNWLSQIGCNETDLDKHMLQLKEKLLNSNKITS